MGQKEVLLQELNVGQKGVLLQMDTESGTEGGATVDGH